MRVVVDTNVVVSFLLRPRSVPGRAFLEISSAHTLLISSPVLREMADVLAYPKLARYVAPETREGFLRRIAFIADMSSRLNALRLAAIRETTNSWN